MRSLSPFILAFALCFASVVAWAQPASTTTTTTATTTTPAGSTTVAPSAAPASTATEATATTTSASGTESDAKAAQVTKPATPAATPGADSGQEQWQVTLEVKDPSKLFVRRNGELITLVIDPNLKGQNTWPRISDFSVGDTLWIRVDAAKKKVTQIDCVPVGSGERLLWMIIFVVVVIVFTLLLMALARKKGMQMRSLLIGADGRYSKSKFQIVVWFGVVIVAYLATYFLRWTDANYLGGISIPTNLALISGFSAFSFAAAKGIASRNGDSPTSPVSSPPGAIVQKGSDGFITDLLTDDNGKADVGDYQMLVIVLVAVVTYLFQVYHFLGTIQFADSITLPDVDSTILATFGLGQGAYLAKKASKSGS